MCAAAVHLSDFHLLKFISFCHTVAPIRERFASQNFSANDVGKFDNNAIFSFRGRHSGKGPAAVSNRLTLISQWKMAVMLHRHASL